MLLIQTFRIAIVEFNDLVLVQISTLFSCLEMHYYIVINIQLLLVNIVAIITTSFLLIF